VTRRIALALVAAALAGGCGDRLGSAKGPNVLYGGVHYSGGPPGAVDPKDTQSGRVRLYLGGQKVDEQALHEGQEFAFKVKRGTYSLSTNLGDFDCVREVSVQQSRVRADLLCQIK
jgi:hypothetical protein